MFWLLSLNCVFSFRPLSYKPASVWGISLVRLVCTKHVSQHDVQPGHAKRLVLGADRPAPASTGLILHHTMRRLPHVRSCPLTLSPHIVSPHPPPKKRSQQRAREGGNSESVADPCLGHARAQPTLKHRHTTGSPPLTVVHHRTQRHAVPPMSRL